MCLCDRIVFLCAEVAVCYFNASCILRDKGNSIRLKTILPKDELMGQVGHSFVPVERKLPMVPWPALEGTGESGQ